jgi:hypothetical protein
MCQRPSEDFLDPETDTAGDDRCGVTVRFRIMVGAYLLLSKYSGKVLIGVRKHPFPN